MRGLCITAFPAARKPRMLSYVLPGFGTVSAGTLVFIGVGRPFVSGMESARYTSQDAWNADKRSLPDVPGRLLGMPPMRRMIFLCTPPDEAAEPQGGIRGGGLAPIIGEVFPPPGSGAAPRLLRQILSSFRRYPPR